MSIRSVPPLTGDAARGVEADLLAAIASGSQTAFAQLYDLTCARVFGLLLSVIGARASAEEVLQDAYLHVWSNASEFATYRGSANAWISEIANRHAVERIRQTADSSSSAIEGLTAPSEAA